MNASAQHEPGLALKGEIRCVAHLDGVPWLRLLRSNLNAACLRRYLGRIDQRRQHNEECKRGTGEATHVKSPKQGLNRRKNLSILEQMQEA
jgi:hypothetical protein